jgi:hypothetical protein
MNIHVSAPARRIARSNKSCRTGKPENRAVMKMRHGIQGGKRRRTFQRCLGRRTARCWFVRSGMLRRLDEEEEGEQGELWLREGRGEYEETGETGIMR